MIDPNATGGTNIQGLQTMDYSYHIRGGIRGINLDGTGNPVPNATQGDLFSYKLDYETAGFYDGNIGKQTWQSTQNNSPLGVRGYTYNYDPVSRLKSATYAGINGEDYSLPNLSYDKNGNITSLQRKGKAESVFEDIDNLTYIYSGNRLTSVADAISGGHEVDLTPRGSGNYTYYTDGSLKSDENEQIINIVYDSYLKQPQEIILSDDRWIKYYYDGGGALLKTVYSTGETWDYTDRIIYKNGTKYQISQEEGRLIYENSDWKFEFQYQDHLGNTRVAFRANGTQLEKTSETAFDPWGVVLNGAGQVNGFQNRREYQGNEKENTFSLNRVNFGFRTMNPTIGRFDRIDLLIDLFESYSGFHYTTNNPINIVDIFGLDTLRVNGLSNDQWKKFNVEKDILSLDAVTINGNKHDTNYSGYIGTFSSSSGDLNVERPISVSGRPFSPQQMYQRSGAVEPNYFLEGTAALKIPAVSLRWLVKLFRFSKLGNVVTKTGLKTLKPSGLGSTGRTVANNLSEQLAMKEAVSNPRLGQIIERISPLKDPRWHGWRKMQYEHIGLDGTKTIIHYNGKWVDGFLEAVDDFKFK